MELLEEFRALISVLETAGVEYALCGGLAMAIYAFPRATLDIDLMVKADDIGKVKSLARDLGFRFDAGPMRFRRGVITIHRVTKIAEGSEEPLALDLLEVTPGIANVWESRQRVTWEEGQLWVVSPKGLTRLKSLRGSGQDRDDIKRLGEISDEG
jgi:hypothetical protein